MSSIIIASVPIHGHVTPLLAVARHLAGRGDRVRFITGARFAEPVAATGATHVPLPGDADFDDREDLEERFPDRAGLKGIKAIAFDIEHIFISPSRPQYDAVMAQHAAEPADAVLTDPAFAGGAFVLGHPRADRPAVIVGGVLPLSLASRDTAPYGLGLPPAKWLNRPRNKLLTALTRRILAGVTRIADAMYRDVHGVALPFPLLDWAGHADAVVQFTVPAFEYPRSDAPATLHFAGPLSATGSQAPRPKWWADLDGGRPVVHVTQGTIANKDFGQLVGPTLEALADVFVTNGGYGGVQYALRYGVPIVATGGKEDKPEVGGRVVWSGVGRRIRTEQPSPRQLCRAIRGVLHQPRYRDASRRIAIDMAAAPGLDGLTAIIDNLTAPAAAAGDPQPTLAS